MIDIERVEEMISQNGCRDNRDGDDNDDDYYSPFINAFERWIIHYVAAHCMMPKDQLVREIKQKFVNNAAVSHQYFQWLADQNRSSRQLEKAKYCEVLAAVYLSFAEHRPASCA
jgi:hypothetical protein